MSDHDIVHRETICDGLKRALIIGRGLERDRCSAICTELAASIRRGDDDTSALCCEAVARALERAAARILEGTQER